MKFGPFVTGVAVAAGRQVCINLFSTGREPATRNATVGSTNHPSGHLVWLLAVVIGLCPAAARALDPTDTATGTGALAHESGGFGNTADGYDALYDNTTGSSNAASGSDALYSNTTGSSNTASGSAALYKNTTGGANTASGVDALFSNTTGGYNAASGYEALVSNTTGNYNTASGVHALYDNTTGNYNTANGTDALHANTTGNDNVAVGAGALSALNGSNNIALGINAGKFTTSGHYNIYIGHPGVSGSESDVTRIGKAQTKVFVAGIAGVPLSGATVVVKANGQLGVVASSARYKQDIRPLADALPGASDKLVQLRPVSFRYKSEPEATHYGLIAEEVDKVMPELVVRDDQNRPESVQYQELIPLLLQEWKAQRALIERQQAELAELRHALAARLATLDGEKPSR